MSIKINAQTVVFKGRSFVENSIQENCEYCHAPFKAIMVTKTIKNTGVMKSLLKLAGNTLITVLSVNGG